MRRVRLRLPSATGPTQCALAHAFAKVIDQASIAVHARAYRGADDRQPPPAFAPKMRQKVDAMADALMKPRINGASSRLTTELTVSPGRCAPPP